MDLARKVVVEENKIVTVWAFVLSVSWEWREHLGMSNGLNEMVLEMRLKGMVNGGITR